MIYVAFRHSDKRLFARLVTFFRGGDSAHVESAIPSPDSHLSLCFSASFIDGGVRAKVIDLTDPRKWRVYRWDGPHVDLMEWLKKNYRVKYDTFGLLYYEVPSLGQDPEKKVCSESCAEHIYLENPHDYDLVALETAVKNGGGRLVVWLNERWQEIRVDTTV